MMLTDALRRLRGALRLACAALLLAACGGGVETGGTGPTGSYVEGPISGFGSIFVAGVRFDDSCNCVEDGDGTRRTRDDLRLGMRVEVDSGAITDDGSGGRVATATRVRFATDLLGPVTATFDAQGLIAVMGQAVLITPATVIDGVAGGAAALSAGEIVEVHGFLDRGLLVDRYVATRVERRSVAPTAYRVRGFVRDLSGTTLRVGGQQYDLSAAAVPAGLANGQLVRMTVATAQQGGLWPVNTIVVETRRLADRGDAEVEGLITSLSSTAAFTVNDVPVDAASASFVDGTGGIVLGARVKVRGRTSGGTLVASSVDLRNDSDVLGDGVDLRGAMSALDAGAQTFVVRGVTIFYGASPEYRNGSVSDLQDGRALRVRATLSADRTRVEATRIEFE